MSWGASLLGHATVLKALENLSIQVGDDAVYVVGTNVEYAVYVEFGTSSQSAQKYLRPAARNASRNIGSIAKGHSSTEAVVKAVALEIEKEARELVPVDTGNLKNSIATQRVK